MPAVVSERVRAVVGDSCSLLTADAAAAIERVLALIDGATGALQLGVAGRDGGGGGELQGGWGVIGVAWYSEQVGRCCFEVH